VATIVTRSRWLLTAILAVVVADHAEARPRITIVYPQEGQSITAVDSEFVVGQALGATRLWVNGVATKLFDSGAFLGWIPVRPGEFTIRIVATGPSGEAKLERKIQVPVAKQTTPAESLRIETDPRLPGHDVWVMPGDLLEIKCRTSPHAEVFFTIPGVAEQVRMTELPAAPQTLFTGNAFRSASVHDTLMLRGVYYAAYRIGPGERADSVRVIFHARSRVTLSGRRDRQDVYASDSVRFNTDGTFADLFTTDSSLGRLTIIDDRFPLVAEIKDSVIVTRYGPGLGYFWAFQPKGTRMEVTGRQGPWVRMRPSPHQEMWAYDTSLAILGAGAVIPKGTINHTRIDGFPDRTEVRLRLTEQLPYRISQSIDPVELTITVYGVTSNIDWIRYDFDDALVAFADWNQPEPGVMEYKVRLNCDQLWGYDSYYDDRTLVLAIRKPPPEPKGLRGLKIVVDAGHSADNGSVGPTGLKEKDANLWIARKLKSTLEKRGAKVTMTREGNEDVPLYTRPILAKAAQPDLFISVHNNAVPDGTNPWESNGVSTYHHYPSAKRLSEYVQGSLLRELEMKNFGLYRANFAVVRPTQYPAILVECAFMIIPEHEAALKTDAFQSKIAEAIAEGVEEFITDSLPDRKYEAAVEALRRHRK
jgi:N-acetylmuramoyl-L-alanine amidase